MKLSKTFFASSFIFASTISFASQDIIVENHTDIYATAKSKYSLCSSTLAGDNGMLKPHQALTIPKSVEDSYCVFGCTVEVYASKNCSGASIFTAHIDHSNGVSSVTNHSSTYHVSGSGHQIALEGGAGIKDWLKGLFG